MTTWWWWYSFHNIGCTVFSWHLSFSDTNRQKLLQVFRNIYRAWLKKETFSLMWLCVHLNKQTNMPFLMCVFYGVWIVPSRDQNPRIIVTIPLNCQKKNFIITYLNFIYEIMLPSFGQASLTTWHNFTAFFFSFFWASCDNTTQLIKRQ